jgi:hypothetical protein
VERLAADNRVHGELVQQARCHLERVARQYVHPIASTLVQVRMGDPAEQILEEAKAEDINLIIPPTCRTSFWNRLVLFWKLGSRRLVSPLAERIIRESTCGVFITEVRTHFDCEKQWGLATTKNGFATDAHDSGAAILKPHPCPQLHSWGPNRAQQGSEVSRCL